MPPAFSRIVRIAGMMFLVFICGFAIAQNTHVDELKRDFHFDVFAHAFGTMPVTVKADPTVIQPGRFQIFTSSHKYLDSDITITLRMDTASGKVWMLSNGPLDKDNPSGHQLSYWQPTFEIDSSFLYEYKKAFQKKAEDKMELEFKDSN